MESPQITQGRLQKAAEGFFRGVNSLRLPWLLDDAQYSWGVNTVNRGGIVQTRPGYLLGLTLPAGNFQGYEIITITKQDPNNNTYQNGAQFLVAAVDGKVYASSFPLSQPETLADWESRRLANLQFNADAKRIIFQVAQKSVDTNAGNISLTTTYSVLIMQDGIGASAYWDGNLDLHMNEDEPDYGVPTGTWMAYSGNRLWVGRGSALLASDLDDPLSFTERLNGIGRGDFLLPDPITGMVNTIGFTFQTNLIVFTVNQTFSFLSYITDRETWDGTPNFETILYPSLGCVAGLSITNHAGLLWWYSDGGLVSSNSATTAYLSSRTKYQDNEMAFATSKMWDDMSGICAASFGSYLLMSIPSGDVFNNATMVLDYSVSDELTSEEAPAWQGVWTGTRPVKWVTAQIASSNNVKMCFQGSVDYEPLNGSHNHIWIAFQDDRTDSYAYINDSNSLEQAHNPIYCEFETKAMGDGLDIKVFKYALFNLIELSGLIDFKVSYRGTQGAYKEVFKRRLIAIVEAWQTTNQNILNLINGGTKLVPQSRHLRTVMAKPQNEESTVSVESKYDGTMDRCFSLLFQWCGRGGVESFQINSEPFQEKPTGESEPDENTLNIVTEDGTSERYPITKTQGVTAVAPPESTPNFANQLYARPITPRHRDVFYSSIPPQSYAAPGKQDITSLPCCGDYFPAVVYDPTLNDVGAGGGPITYIGNDPQTYTATCPAGSTGTPVTISVIGNFFFAETKEGANVIAYNYCLEKANAQIECSSTPPPVVTSQAQNIPPSTPFNYQIIATNSPTSYGATNLPSGLSIDTATGVISGTIDSSSLATYTIGLTAQNISGTGSGTLTLTVAVPYNFIAYVNYATSGTGTLTQNLFQISLDNGAFFTPSAGTNYPFENNIRAQHQAASSSGIAEANIDVFVNRYFSIGAPPPILLAGSTLATSLSGTNITSGYTSSSVSTDSSPVGDLLIDIDTVGAFSQSINYTYPANATMRDAYATSFSAGFVGTINGLATSSCNLTFQ